MRRKSSRNKQGQRAPDEGCFWCSRPLKNGNCTGCRKRQFQCTCTNPAKKIIPR